MIIYIIYFAVIAFLVIEYEFRPFKPEIPLLLLTIALGFLAGLRGPDVARDYTNYLINFEIVNQINDPIFLTILEPGFIAIVYIIRLIASENYPLVIMCFFALSAVALKLKMFKELTFNPFLAGLLYFSQYFFLHEMTQIRIGLASALFFVGVPYYLRGQKLTFIAFVLLGTAFHYSAILYLAVFIFDARKFSKPFYIGVLGLSVVLAFFRPPFANYFASLDSAQVSVKLDTYSQMGVVGYFDQVNVFNVVTLTNIACCLYFLLFVPKEVFIKSKIINFFLKCNLLSIFLLALFSGVASVAFRISEIFNVASIFLFTYLATKLPFGKLNIFVVVLVAVGFFLVNVIIGHLVGPYYPASLK